MADQQPAPFSARHRGPHRQIDADFPASARNGLLHLLFDLIEKSYVGGWIPVARELQRLGRLTPGEYNASSAKGAALARDDAEAALASLTWQKAYDFCERLHSHLAREVGYHDNFEFHVTTSKSDVQAYISDELRRLLLEEGLAFEFAEGTVRRRGRKHTVDISTRAQVVLGDPRLGDARRHYEKALHFFRSLSKPDYENAAKESVCAVEAACKALFPESKAATLGDFAKWVATAKTVEVPKGLVQTITGIYAYRSGGDGVGHGGATGGRATAEVAEYVLAVCASQIIYLVVLANLQDVEVPVLES
jgi:hypothetical protein